MADLDGGRLGISAARMDSSLSTGEIREAATQLRSGTLRLLYYENFAGMGSGWTPSRGPEAPPPATVPASSQGAASAPAAQGGGGGTTGPA